MKRWCFDNKNKKNNFYTQRIQSFFLFFQIIFFLFLFLILFFKHRNSFFYYTHLRGEIFTRFLDFFYAHPHAYTPRFLPRTLKTRALPPPCPFRIVRQFRRFRRFRIFRQFTLRPYNSEFSEHSKMYIYTFPDFTTNKLSEYS